MTITHMTPWQQEEYVAGQRTPQMLRHLSECAACAGSVARLEQSLGIFRDAAVQWSAECLAVRPQQIQILSVKRRSALVWRWAVATAIPLVLLLIALLPFHLSSPRIARPPAHISDDALLEQVDEQLSVAVPSSMESLTHLVSSDSSGAANAGPAAGSKQLVQTN